MSEENKSNESKTTNKSTFVPDHVRGSEEGGQKQGGDPAMEKARKGGWVPKSEWKGDPSDWVDYREFNVRGELMGHIKKSNDTVARLARENKVITSALEKFRDMNTKLAEKEADAIISQLEQDRVEAMSDGNFDEAVKIEKKIEKAKEQLEGPAKKAGEETPQGSQVPENFPKEFLDFADRNKEWYGQDPRMTQWTDRVGELYALENPEATPTDIIEHVESKLQEKYPEQFGGVKKPRQSNTLETKGDEPPAKDKDKGAKKSSITLSDLDPEDQQVVKRMAKGSKMTVQQYIDMLAEQGTI